MDFGGLRRCSVLSNELAKPLAIKERSDARKPVVSTFEYQLVPNNHLQAPKMLLLAILTHLVVTTVQPPLSLTSADWLESQLATLSSQPVLRKDHEIQRLNAIKNQRQFRQQFSIRP
jgi:hypothetical protein